MATSTAILLACVLTGVASVVGAIVPLVWQPSHRWMQVLLSLIAGVMAGVAALDLLPHAIEGMQASHAALHTEACDHDHDHAAHAGLRSVMLWAVGGFLCMYLLERFVCFHHHEQGDDCCPAGGHGHTMSWIGACSGLTVHALIAGFGLGAATMLEGAEQVAWPGVGMLLAIGLHKPFDGLAIVTLLRRDGRSVSVGWITTLAYACVTPVGIAVAWAMGGVGGVDVWAAPAVAVTAGLLLCVALSDVLPELQMHSHDRLLLSGALVAGVLVAVAASSLH
ncbi:MAG: ZIP family metal transporter [Phycisphaerales bacterium]|jgi:zinc and cadmium transporter|nr:ZIP family metal transporter [Phycisphaerales bacterium]